MAKMVKCKTCGNVIASDAKSCPHCGSKNKRGLGCCSGIIIIAVIVAIAGYASMHNRGGNTSSVPESVKSEAVKKGNAVLENRLSYLKSDVKELCRVEFIRNDVYISFSNDKLPDDYKIIANVAAVNGSRALVDAHEIPTRCSVWVIPVASKAGDVDKIYYNANARNGKIY